MSRFTGVGKQRFTYLGIVNRGWGVCGFTSAVYAMYDKRPGDRAMLINATRHYTVLASIKTFLNELRAAGEEELIREIEEYNRTFDRPDWTIADYIKTINESEITEDFSRDTRYGIAMPPKGVDKYLQTWGFRTVVRRMKGFTMDLGGDAIVGVKNAAPDPTKTLYDGLIHWMYRHRGKIYSWGREFKTVKDAGIAVGKNYKVTWVIEIHNPPRG
jgi:hypothetical protein